MKTTINHRQQQHHTLRNILSCIGMSALCVVAHYIRIPLPYTPVPLIVQPLGAFGAGLLLGPWYGLASQILYACALPFTAWRTIGGMAMLYGPTAGYVWGIVISSAVVGLLAHHIKGWRGTVYLIAITACIIHLPGMLILRTWHFYAGMAQPSWLQLIYQGMLPFLIGDIIKAALISLFADK